MSSMAVGPVLRSHSTDDSLLPWKIAWSCSLQPVALAWRNIVDIGTLSEACEVPTVNVP